ncbi:DUF2089 domain-containing protein [Sulfobacillus thermosulfidooxidans]|uniref:DUF2089 domain-containing protein n=1 Tax=Sulfobacillus thermosulfidooxidans TaxID=28034 RepID=UPI00096BC2DC|nr:DUF2089 domain-containing protein [Sulfobacillus thermosulfidooxidans]OLZ10644.1 hypothetical protein BFX05_09945 [Sulfobacillus thermosulfidooxidans]OLZ17535.1 hypothetical protein BFX06_13070 [Sulfobacillus thermosulfidooxidans]OLZ20901.1 hypothetical protein BFX07_14295 [Sulfobacillus thermosulfidooxidans]
MPNVLTTCPSCRHPLEITALHCPHCDIVIQGRFHNSPALSLSEDQLAFLKVFVLSRGNLKEIERILGISYPTVRNKLDQLVEVFQGRPGEETSSPPKVSRNEILQRIAQKELSVQDGLKLLDDLARNAVTEPSFGSLDTEMEDEP